MTRIIISIALIAAVLQAHATLQQGDTTLGAWRSVVGLEALTPTEASEERIVPHSSDTGNLGGPRNSPSQWIAHPGPTDVNGCHTDEYDRWHCH